MQWLQLYEFDLRLVASVLKALSPHFTDYVVYVPDASDILIVASTGRTVPAPDAGILEAPGLASELRRIRVHSVQDLVIRQVADRALLDSWLATAPVAANSDYHPMIDQQAARARFLDRDALALLSLGSGLLPVLEILNGAPPLWAKTSITPSPFLPVSMAAYRATLLRDLLQGQAVDEAIQPTVMTEARQLLERCAATPMHLDRRPVLFALGMSLAGLLRPAELPEIWRVLEIQPCATSLTVLERAWWNLFAAIGNRDPQAMAALAANLLAQTDEPPERRAFLLAVVLLSERTRVNPQGPRDTGKPIGSPAVQDTQTRPGGRSLLLEVLAAPRRPGW